MDIIQVIKLYELIRNGRRVSIKTLHIETGMNRRTIYRYVKDLARIIPIRLDEGVITPSGKEIESTEPL